MKRWVPLAAGIAVAVCFSAAAEEIDPQKQWPAWRGPLATGVAPHGDPPIEWSETKNVRWKTKLPAPGHASPIVWGDRVYVLAAVRTDKEGGSPAGAAKPAAALPAMGAVLPAVLTAEQETPPPVPPAPAPQGGPPRPPAPTHVHRFVVLALDRATGKTLWETTVREEVPHEAGHVTASLASASPVTDGERVYAFFGSRGLHCLDRAGKVIWSKDLGRMRTRNEFGEGASPALYGDTLVVNWDHEGDSFILALDKRTGEERWRVAREEPTSWSTPLVVRDGERTLVAVSATKRVRAYDLKSGAVVWEIGGLGPNCIPTPVADGERLFAMSGYREAAGFAVRYPGASGDLTTGDRVAWRIDSGLSYVPSPLLYDGTLYMLERFGNLLSSHDFKTGKPHYAKHRVEAVSNVYASPVGAAGRVYLLDREGTAAVFRHGPTFELLAQNTLDDDFDATPAIAGRELFLRGHAHLYCIANP